MKSKEQIIKSLRKGQFFSVSTFTGCEEMNKKLKKRDNPFLGRVSRETTYDGVRFVDYENMASVKEKREQGIEAKEPWYEWVDFPYIAVGKKNRKQYAIVKPTTNVRITSRYFVDGVEISKESLLPYILKSGSTEEASVLSLELSQIKYICQGNIIYKEA